jgi:hypothetical protein
MASSRGTMARPVSGWIMFTAVLAIIIGAFNVLSGFGAVFSDENVEELGEVLYGINIDAWGWFWIIIGALQVLTGVLIFQRSELGRWLGVLWATLAAALTVMVVFVAPLWTAVVITFEVLIIYALVVRWDETA